jgi:hypothetical protein
MRDRRNASATHWLRTALAFLLAVQALVVAWHGAAVAGERVLLRALGLDEAVICASIHGGLRQVAPGEGSATQPSAIPACECCLTGCAAPAVTPPASHSGVASEPAADGMASRLRADAAAPLARSYVRERTHSPRSPPPLV